MNDFFKLFERLVVSLEKLATAAGPAEFTPAVAGAPGGAPPAVTVPASPAGTPHPGQTVPGQTVPGQTIPNRNGSLGPVVTENTGVTTGITPQAGQPPQGPLATAPPGPATSAPQSQGAGQAPVQGQPMDYDAMDLPALKKLCNERGIDIQPKSRATTYVKKLNEWDKLNPAGVQTPPPGNQQPSTTPPGKQQPTTQPPGTQPPADSAGNGPNLLVTHMQPLVNALIRIPQETVDSLAHDPVALEAKKRDQRNFASETVTWILQTATGLNINNVTQVPVDKYQAVIDLTRQRMKNMGFS